MVYGTQALIAEWSRRYKEAVAFARAGQQFAVTTDSCVRLAAIEARALSKLGKPGAAVIAIDRAQRARDQDTGADDLASFGGILTFPFAKQLYYVGGALTTAGHPDAERLALEAIRLYESGPVEERSYGDEALARVDVATARLNAGDLDGAVAALAPVLELPPAQRIHQLCDGLVRVRSALALPPFHDARNGVELVSAIDNFSDRGLSTDALSSSR
ncbi:hypothetical protein [Pseudonocardia sp.]|uniref:hypothetical protein n=1 Tax=Pseudonocardia sp. TaxID=60912 RepID=UPI002632396A|nr:hypothetical protein [Pseudonocardia sp.]